LAIHTWFLRWLQHSLLAAILTVIVGLPILALVVIFLLAVLGRAGFAECADATGGEVRTLFIDPSQAASFQSKWDNFNDTLENGNPSQVMFDESESTSRARSFLDENGAPVSDAVVCFHSGEGEGSGKVDIPVLSAIPGIGDVDVRVSGTVDFSGATPEAVVSDIEVGGLPSFMSDRAKGIVSDLIDRQLDSLDLDHQYDIAFEEGQAVIDGQP
jgi:hypothetical protein